MQQHGVVPSLLGIVSSNRREPGDPSAHRAEDPQRNAVVASIDAIPFALFNVHDVGVRFHCIGANAWYDTLRSNWDMRDMREASNTRLFIVRDNALGWDADLKPSGLPYMIG
jgi:hypothetical protein